MATKITSPVGRWERNARNDPTDVKIVQQLLTSASKKLGDPKYDPKGIDGKIARPPRTSATIKAIETFQARFMQRPDGVVDPGGRTWRELTQIAPVAMVVTVNTPTKGQYCFPFAQLPSHNWTSPPRSFASNRSGGTRAHAGCDLYFPQGTWIHAVADGTVVRGPYAFYAQTHAIDVDHGAFLARYGEIQRIDAVTAGTRVQVGQRIARVGHLIGIVVPSDMLHLELYDKSATGDLNQPAESSKRRADGIPFRRRKDLIDPTSKLNIWKANLPPD